MGIDPLIFLRTESTQTQDLMTPVVNAFPPGSTIVQVPPGSWIHYPCPPFLTMLRDRCRSPIPGSLKKLISKCEVYSLHRSLFLDYLSGNPVVRHEEVIPEEAQYEQIRFFEGLWSLWLQILGPGPGLLTIPQISKMPCSTIEFLKWWKLKAVKKDWTICLVYNSQEMTTQSESWIALWEDLVNTLGINMPLHRRTHSLSPAQQHIQGNTDLPPIPELWNLYHFFAYQDLIGALAERLEDPSVVGHPEEMVHRELLGRAYLLTGDLEKASLEFYRLLEISTERGHQKAAALAHQLTGIIQYRKDHTEGSLKSCLLSLELAKTVGDIKIQTLGQFLILLNDARENQLSQGEWEEIYRGFVINAQTLGWDNHLAYWLSRPDRLHPFSDGPEVDRYQDQAIKTSKALGNEMRLAAAYHTKGYTLLLRGQAAEVPKFYKKSESLKKKLGNALETAYVQNGLGYFFHQIGEQTKAEKYLFLCLEKAQEAGDYHEVGMALCNIAILYVYTGWPDLALEFLRELALLMRTLHINGLSYHSDFEIDGLTALAHLRAGRELMYREYLDRLDRAGGRAKESRPGSQVEEALLYMVLKAQSQGLEGRFDQAQKLFDQADRFLQEHHQTLKHRQSFLDDERDWLRGLIRGRRMNRPKHLDKPRRRPDFRPLRETARLTASHQYLQKKLEEVHLLTLLRNLLVVEVNPESLIREALDLLRRNVASDIALYAKGKEEAITWIADSEAPNLTADEWDSLKGLIRPGLESGKNLHFHRSGIWPRNLPGNAWLVLPLKEGDKTEARLILGVLKNDRDFDEEDLSILDLAAAQISQKMESIANDRLIRQKNQELESSNRELQESLAALKQAQVQLIASEKMAVLGTLVAGIAHEINTPVGISVTTASYLSTQAEGVLDDIKHGNLTRTRFDKFLKDMKESSDLLSSNLERAAELIKSFKQVSVDQTNEQERPFYLDKYLKDIVQSLNPQLKQKKIKVNITCPEDLKVWSFPGAFSQIFTNLSMNTLNHGFRNSAGGTIEIGAQLLSDGQLEMTYQDSGCGMTPEDQAHHFEPFYTTMRNSGGTGLGTYIVYNLVTQRLKGEISLQTSPGQGVLYRIVIPLKFPS